MELAQTKNLAPFVAAQDDWAAAFERWHEPDDARGQVRNL